MTLACCQWSLPPAFLVQSRDELRAAQELRLDERARARSRKSHEREARRAHAVRVARLAQENADRRGEPYVCGRRHALWHYETDPDDERLLPELAESRNVGQLRNTCG